jgi:hypothetical protein
MPRSLGSSATTCSRVDSTRRPSATIPCFLIASPDHSKGLLADLPVGHDVIGPVDIEIIDLVSRYELINIDGAGRLDLDGLEVFVVTST